MKWIIRIWLIITIAFIVIIVIKIIDKQVSLKYEAEVPSIGLQDDSAIAGIEQLLKKAIIDNIFFLKLFLVYIALNAVLLFSFFKKWG